jgi:tripartite-type tricarboxylate transporter receptor subunit TctC
VIAAYREAFAKLVGDPGFAREAAQAQLIVKIASADEVTASVARIHDNPRPVIEQATALLRSIAE